MAKFKIYNSKLEIIALMALYHKHRPQTFTDIVDQAHIITTLVNQIKNNKVAHAYLFSGPRGIGKTTTARILAKSLNCEKKKERAEEPCNTCDTCAEISESRSIDVIEIDAASHTGVDNVRQNIIENAQFKPTKSKYKIFIIDEVHMLSTAAFNALLKTLEEPPEYVMFILATTDPHKLPATIISRCQRFNFSKVSDEEMKKYLKSIATLENVKVDDEVLLRILRKGEGCVRDAISLLDQIMASGDKTITTKTAALILPTTNIEFQLNFAEHLIKKDQTTGINFVNKLAEDGVSLPHFTLEFIELLRALMISHVDTKLSEKELDLNKESRKRLQELVKLSSSQEIVQLIDLTIKRSGEIKTSPLPQLPLEMLVVEWCSDHDTRYTTKQDTDGAVKYDNKDQKIVPPSDGIPASSGKRSEDQRDNQVDVEIKSDRRKLVERVKQAVSKKSIEQTEIEERWNECMAKLEEETPSLVFILKMSDILKVDNNTISLAVEYKFHQEKLMEKKTKHKLESILSDFFETKIKIDVSVQEATKKNKEEKQSGEIQELASALGGEVIT